MATKFRAKVGSLIAKVRSKGSPKHIISILEERRRARQTLTPEEFIYLSRSNPYLQHLSTDYEALNYFDHSMWENWRRTIDLRNFRRENNYLSQLDYGTTAAKYWATFGYVSAQDDQDYLTKFPEDDRFGIVTFTSKNGLVITRDLLDSILEIDFLRTTLQIMGSDKPVLVDIGAGYGRFAHRFSSAFPQSYIYCSDGIPESTFLCDFYIKYRHFSDSAQSVPLSEIKQIQYQPIDIAVNIHSFSECTLTAIKFWLDFVSDLNANYLFIVPHTPEFLTKERDGQNLTFLPEIKAHGYKLEYQKPKFSSSNMQALGIFPATYYLFKRGL